jgi:hypothetical protein
MSNNESLLEARDAELLAEAAKWLHEYAKKDGPRPARMGEWVDAIDRAGAALPRVPVVGQATP